MIKDMIEYFSTLSVKGIIEWITFIGFILALLHLLILGLIYNLTHKLDNLEKNYFYPTTLYENTKMNAISCIVVSLILIAINYLYTIPYLLYRAIYFITHVGRNEEEREDE